MENHQEMIEIRIEGRGGGGGGGGGGTKTQYQQDQAAAAAEKDGENIKFKKFDIILLPTDDVEKKKKKKKKKKKSDKSIIIKDHHFASSSKKQTEAIDYSSQTKERIMKEWEILKESLPAHSIYVRAYEGRIDLLRAVIIGAPGTPYHDGLFFFDIKFPSDYPIQPPKFHYRSPQRVFPLCYNLRMNGRVTLPLLNTCCPMPPHKIETLPPSLNAAACFPPDKIHETHNTMWNPEESTVLQVLVELQTLILNPKPFYNPFKYDHSLSHVTRSLLLEREDFFCWEYNRGTFLLNCETMLKVLAMPPNHFEEFVAQHFRHRAETILIAYKAYIDGRADVGQHPIPAIDNSNNTEASSSSSSSSTTVAATFAINDEELDPYDQYYQELVKAFIKNGSSSLENYLDPVSLLSKLKYLWFFFPVVVGWGLFTWFLIWIQRKFSLLNFLG